MPNNRCPKCGFENRPGARFCKNCGSPITSQVSSPQSHPGAPVRKNRHLIRSISILVVLILLVGGGFLIYQNMTKPESPQIYTMGHNIAGDYYYAPLQVMIDVPDGTEVYYTTDNSEPSINSEKYNDKEGIVINWTKTVRAVAIDEKGHRSDPVAKTFIITGSTGAVNTGSGNSSTTTEDSTNTDSETDSAEEQAVSTRLSALVAEIITTGDLPGNPSEYTKNYKASASSTLAQQGNNTYLPSNLLDSNSSTAWVEGASGNGIGESFTLTYQGSETSFQSIYFYNGYCKSDDIWKQNGCVTEFSLLKNGSQILTIYLEPTSKPQKVTLQEAESLENGDTLEFRIENVQQGVNDSDMDTAISEIIVA